MVRPVDGDIELGRERHRQYLGIPPGCSYQHDSHGRGRIEVNCIRSFSGASLARQITQLHCAMPTFDWIASGRDGSADVQRPGVVESAGGDHGVSRPHHRGSLTACHRGVVRDEMKCPLLDRSDRERGGVEAEVERGTAEHRYITGDAEAGQTS